MREFHLFAQISYDNGTREYTGIHLYGVPIAKEGGVSGARHKDPSELDENVHLKTEKSKNKIINAQ